MATLLAGVVFIGGGIGVLTGEFQATPVLSGSMVPRLPVGSVAVSQRESVRDLRVGDIALLHPPFGAPITYVHEIVKLRRVRGLTQVNTRGIANPIADPWTVVIRGTSVYVVRWDIPYVGYLVSWVRTPTGRASTVSAAGLLSLLLVLWFVRDVWRSSHADSAHAASSGVESVQDERAE